MHHQLILMRHGHATFEASSDYLRPLTEAGRAAVAQTAAQLRQWLASKPATILTSDTLRTRQSAEIVAETCAIPPDNILSDPELYGATPGLWLKKIPQVLRQTGRDVLICMGHNPAMSQLMSILTGETTHMRAGSAALIDSLWQGDEVVLPAERLDFFDPNPSPGKHPS